LKTDEARLIINFAQICKSGRKEPAFRPEFNFWRNMSQEESLDATEFVVRGVDDIRAELKRLEVEGVFSLTVLFAHLRLVLCRGLWEVAQYVPVSHLAL
jgi:hypothetical protein